MKRFLLLICIAFTVVPAEAQRVFSLDDCIQTGLERNYSIRIIRNEQQISDNNATPGNAGYLPTVDLSSGFSGTLNNNNNKLSDGTTEKTNGIHNETADRGVDLYELFRYNYEYIQSDRYHHADRSGGEKRYFDRRVCQPAPGSGTEHGGSDPLGFHTTSAADPDDQYFDDLRIGSARICFGRRGTRTYRDGYRRSGRYDRFDIPYPVYRPGDVQLYFHGQTIEN